MPQKCLTASAPQVRTPLVCPKQTAPLVRTPLVCPKTTAPQVRTPLVCTSSTAPLLQGEDYEYGTCVVPVYNETPPRTTKVTTPGQAEVRGGFFLPACTALLALCFHNGLALFVNLSRLLNTYVF